MHFDLLKTFIQDRTGWIISGAEIVEPELERSFCVCDIRIRKNHRPAITKYHI